MPYIGTQPLTGQFKKLDAISVVNGQAAYTLNHNGVAYKPATANALLVSVNGVIQAAGDAFNISGSTITFTENLVTGDVIDFIIALGDTGSAVTPVDGSVTTAKIASSAVDLTSKVTGTLPVANGGTALTSGFFNGISHHNLWRLNSDFSVTSSQTTLTDWADSDNVDNYKRIGTAWSHSSGVFTPPVTGLWEICVHYQGYSANAMRYIGIFMNTSTDGGSTFTTRDTYAQHYSSGSVWYSNGNYHDYFNVSSTSTFRFKVDTQSEYQYTLRGSSSLNVFTKLLFKRVGDAQ